MLQVKIRRLEGNAHYQVVGEFPINDRAGAEALALRINCKAFTPFYSWVEEA